MVNLTIFIEKVSHFLSFHGDILPLETKQKYIKIS